MKILYAIQGTGNGHISRAIELVPVLKKKADVDVLISGVQADLQLPFSVKYKFRGLSFIFGKKGGISFWKTFKQIRLKHFIKEIIACPVHHYDLVINDFEPVSAWSCKMKGVPCIALSHQAAFRSKKVPVTKHKDLIGAFILKKYAPCLNYFGFHFEKYDDHIYGPIIRTEIRNKSVTRKGHYTVYLPSYSDEKLIRVLSKIKDIKWQVFSKHASYSYQHQNIQVSPLSAPLFIDSLASSNGVLCGAGFETPAEALFLKKKLLVVPMKMQYEQHLNAESLSQIGVEVLKKISLKHVPKIQAWVSSDRFVEVHYPDETLSIVNHVLAFAKNSLAKQKSTAVGQYAKLYRKATDKEAFLANGIKS